MLRIISVSIFFLYFSCVALGQSVPVLHLSGIQSDTLLSKVAVWRITAKQYLPADTLKYDTYAPLAPSRVFGRDSIYWVRFDINNDSPEALRMVFLSPYANDEVHFYISGNQFRTVRHEVIGKHTSYWDAAFRYTNLLLPIEFAAGQTLSFLLKIENQYTSIPSSNIQLLTEQSLKNDFWTNYSTNFNGIYISIFILGAVFAIFLFVVFLYVTTRNTLYLYYGLYLGGVVVYFSMKTDTLFFLGYWINGSPKFVSLINEPIQLLYTGLYIRFCMGLLRINQYDPGLNRFLDFCWKGLILYSIIVLLVAGIVWRREFDLNLLAIDRLILLLFNIVMLWRILQKNKSPLLTYFLVGNIIFISGVVVSTVISLGIIDPGADTTLSPINYFQIGVLGEIMCFSFALGFNVRLLEIERTYNHKAFIHQLRLNQKITEGANRELTEKLEKRTREVLSMSKILQQQQEAHLRSEFEFQLGEMEMQALRAQMNPHFIFNSLNTIRYFVLNNENDKASDYLGKFARLLRMVLQNSRENTIPLSEELEALRLYIEIEARRFGESFQYEIVVQEGMDTEGIIVPPLLLQPFVENAVWHGLLHSNNSDKQLSVRISEDENSCLFVIEDNGIGRTKARQMKSRSANIKKSFGMQITNKRVELFNKNFTSQIKIAVKDVVNPEGEVGGTIVEIRYQLPD